MSILCGLDSMAYVGPNMLVPPNKRTDSLNGYPFSAQFDTTSNIKTLLN